MRLRDNLDQYDPKVAKKKAKEPPKKEQKKEVRSPKKETKPQAPEKKIEAIITKEDMEEEFRRWKPDCNCDAKILYRQKKPGGNWIFYKECAVCGSKSTTLYRVRSNIDEFLQSDRGQFWKKEKEG